MMDKARFQELCRKNLRGDVFPQMVVSEILSALDKAMREADDRNALKTKLQHAETVHAKFKSAEQHMSRLQRELNLARKLIAAQERLLGTKQALPDPRKAAGVTRSLADAIFIGMVGHQSGEAHQRFPYEHRRKSLATTKLARLVSAYRDRGLRIQVRYDLLSGDITFSAFGRPDGMDETPLFSFSVKADALLTPDCDAANSDVINDRLEFHLADTLGPPALEPL